MASDGKSPLRSTFASFLASQEPFEIFDEICSYLNTAEFQKLRRVCKRYYEVENLQRRFNINKLLCPFISDVPRFRSELGKYDALISGGFALNFFDLGLSTVSVLDLFVEAGRRTDEIIAYIRDSEGFDKEGYLGEAWFVFSCSKRPGKTIRLTATNGPPIETILCHSFATTNVNFITWNKAYSIFPRQTLIHHKFHPLKPWNDEFGSFLREQADQGWTTRDIIWPDLKTDVRYQIENCYRRVGDQSSLIISLDTKNVENISTPDSVIEFAQFEISTDPEPPSRFAQAQWEGHSLLQIRAQPLSSRALRYEYTQASKPWSKFVAERLQRWVWLELLKLKAGERPEQFENGVPYDLDISIPSDFQSETWDYADDQIPAWYEEWEQTRAEETSISRRNRNGRRRVA